MIQLIALLGLACGKLSKNSGSAEQKQSSVSGHYQETGVMFHLKYLFILFVYLGF